VTPPHPLVEQLRFTRSEFARAIEGVSDADAARRFPPLNCISWNVGHLAWQEQRAWLLFGQKELPMPDINTTFATGAPASTPALSAVRDAWRTITAAADPFLDRLTGADLAAPLPHGTGPARTRTAGSVLQRMLYHYWFHAGENMAIRQYLGQVDLPQFVGDIDAQAPYRPA
jgi:hypothetical protein